MPDAHANEVVKAASAKGIGLTPSFVYAIRAMDKKRNGRPVGKPGRRPGLQPKRGEVGPRKGAGKAASAATPDVHESAFRRMVVQTLGLARAQEILKELADIGL